MKNKSIFILGLALLLLSCGGSTLVIKNCSDKTPTPKLTASDTFVITEYSKEKRYGTEKEYPINVFYGSAKNDSINVKRFLNALAGPHGEPIRYSKVKTCCPFTSKHSEMGVGLLEQYKITWPNQKIPMLLYFNNYEKGPLLVPVGLRLK
jgi:hypothetical protein